MNRYATLIFVFTLLVFSAPNAEACSCMPDNADTLEESVRGAYKKADAVVLAYVLSKENLEPVLYEDCPTGVKDPKPGECKTKTSYRKVVANFVTERSWKGSPGDEFRIVNDNMCDEYFDTGETYLIYMYATTEESVYDTSFCSRTQLLSLDTEAEMEVLDKTSQMM